MTPWSIEHFEVPLLLAVLLVAASSAHRQRAVHAEAVGRMQEAAREYEAAWDDEHAPDLLYRLGVVRRKLKQYAKAREALRAYLREAPNGGLRDEVERQLTKLEVLIEAQAEDFSEEKRAPAPAARARAAAPPAATPPVLASPAAAPPVAPPVAAPVAAPPVAAPSAAGPAAPAAVVAASPIVAPAVPRAATELAVAAVSSHTAGKWLAGAAAVTAVAGAYFWWDGARLSRDLDARFAAGDLTPADRSLYPRAHAASVAARVLAAGALGFAAAAVWQW